MHPRGGIKVQGDCLGLTVGGRLAAFYFAIEKGSPHTLVHIFTKYLKILSLEHLAGYLQQSNH